ncbi:MAG: endonuclease/exonuclease/phosphatase family protein, partial [Pirellulales bacterium]|nr:endonuclease/exonuclease/phosphatase family protein [Pirellulales bacterium]
MSRQEAGAQTATIDAGEESRTAANSFTQEQTVPVRMMAYNVHLLPEVAARIAGKRSASAYRAKAIAERLLDYDIVGISEAFDRKHTKTLLDTVKANSPTELAIARGPGRSGRHMIGGGLLLLSRWPIEETHAVTYSSASRFMTSGFKADGFAAKGALHARLRLGSDVDACLDCFLTHLESRSKKARGRQIEQLADFVEEHSSLKIPMVVLGDFNVAADNTDKSYQRLCQALSPAGRQLIDVGKSAGGTSDALAEDGGRRIDYIFISPARVADSSRLEPVETRTVAMRDDEVPEASLSDHLAVACQANCCY